MQSCLMNLSYSKDAVSKIKRINGRWLTLAFVSFIISTSLMATVSYNVFAQAVSSSGSGATGTTLPSDDTFSLVPVSKAVTKQTCQLSGSKGWSCRMTTTHVQPPPLGSATVYLEWGGSEIRLGSITGSGMINNIPRDTDIKIIVSGGFHPITESIHTPLSQTNYAYTCIVGGCNVTPKSSSNTASTTLTQTLPSDDTFSLVPVSKAVTKQTCQLSGSKGWSCRMTTTHVQPPPLGSATVYLEWGGSEIRLGSITGSGMINNIPRDTDIKIIVSGGFHPITESIHTPLSQTNYAYTCIVGGCNVTPKSSSNTASTTLTQTLPSDDTFSLVPVSKAVTKQTCQLSGSKGWSCRMTTTHVQPPPLGSATVYLEWGGSEIRLGSITGSGMINNIPRDTDIKIIVSGGFHPITESIHTPLSQINYVYVCTIDGCNFTPNVSSNIDSTTFIQTLPIHYPFSLIPV